MTQHIYMIGDLVDVMCDHKRGGRRVRDWVEGVVVHADERMTAIQFRNDVYLTDGWMVPDRILWFNKGTDKLRAARGVHSHPKGKGATAKLPARKAAAKAPAKSAAKARH
jgi:hypothetical protein